MKHIRKLLVRVFFLLIGTMVGNIYAMHVASNPFELDLNALAQPANCAVLEKLLSDGGIEINEQDADKRTLMHYAATNENQVLLAHLLRLNGDPNIQDVDENTPFHIVFLSGNLQAIQVVVSHLTSKRDLKFNYTLRNRHGLSLLNCAKSCQRSFSFRARLYKSETGGHFVEFSLNGKPPYATYYKSSKKKHKGLCFSLNIHGRRTWIIPYEGMFFCLIDKYKKLRAWDGWVYADPFPIVQAVNFLEKQEKILKKQNPTSHSQQQSARKRSLKRDACQRVEEYFSLQEELSFDTDPEDGEVE